MKRKSSTRCAFFNARALLAFTLCLVGAMLAFCAFGGLRGAFAKNSARAFTRSAQKLQLSQDNGFERFSDTDALRTRAQQGQNQPAGIAAEHPRTGIPKEVRMAKSGRSFDGSLRTLPSQPQPERPKFQHAKVLPNPRPLVLRDADVTAPAQSSIAPGISAPAPAPLVTFEGLGRAGGWGTGYPPDTVGDVGPNHYIQSINSAMAIYNKATGALMAGPLSLDTLMSQGNFGNLCDNENRGDPVVLYDTFEDRWIVTGFAFKMDAQNNIISPPGTFQCFAVSKTGDPVNGGWNFYSIQQTDGMHDYEKLGVWTDGIYMSANMFSFVSGGGFQGTRTWAINKAQMYAGAATAQNISFDIGKADFTLLPSNARLQTGTPPAGAPNYFISTWNHTNAVQVYKFKVNWDDVSLSSFTGPFNAATGEHAPTTGAADVPQGGTTQTLDVLGLRAMMQNQYANIGGVESLWATHTVRRADNSGAAAPRWYQVNVTGGNVAANTLQRATWDPDGNNNTHRWMASLAVDRAGNMALGYSASGTNLFPSIRYAGRLATDPANTFSQTEQTLFAGGGSQEGGINRWGDYSAMSLDPDGCRFWYTTEYYAVSGMDYRTRIGSFKFAACTPVGNGGTISGKVTAAAGGAAIPGATVSLGSRTTTTNGSGNYSFTGLPAGTYPSQTVTVGGYNSSTATGVVVTDNGTTTKNFALTAAPTSGCLVDTSLADFQDGVASNVDVTTTPGSVTLAKARALDQQTTNYTNNGAAFDAGNFAGQTFTPNSTGPLQKIDVFIFCAGCTGANPDLTLEVRNTSSGAIVMSGGPLASSTIAGTSSGDGAFMTFAFATPPTVSAGTTYGFLLKSTATRAQGIQGVLVSDSDGLAGGERQTCDSWGWCWGGWGDDLVFKAYLQGGYSASGNLISGRIDANPAPGVTATWENLTWTNAALPAGTNVQFHAAASNNPAGPFDFVGPNGTTGTFFTKGGSLARFNGMRYLKYKAILSTNNGSNTPTLQDVTVCFNNGSVTPTPTPTPTPKPTATPTPTPTATPTPTPTPKPTATPTPTPTPTPVAKALVTGIANPTKGGTVIGGGTFRVGSTQELTAVPNDGWKFDSWSNGSTANPRTITVREGGSSYTANFVRKTALITGVANPTHAGVVQGGGRYPVGSTQQLKAVPQDGWRFKSWSNGSTANPRAVTVREGGASYTANFVRKTATITVFASPNRGGVVNGGGTFPVGSTQQLKAVPKAGWRFKSWSDGNTRNPRSVVVRTGGAVFTAKFVLIQ